MPVATTRRRKGATSWTTEATDGKRRSALLVETGSLAMPSLRPSGYTSRPNWIDTFCSTAPTDRLALSGDRFLLRLDQSSSGSFDSNAAAR
jgi:hypothetical protein